MYATTHVFGRHVPKLNFEELDVSLKCTEHVCCAGQCSPSSSRALDSIQRGCPKCTPQPVRLNVKVQFSSLRIISRLFPIFRTEHCICCLAYSCQEPGSLSPHTDFQLLERILQIKQQAPSVPTTQLAMERICFLFLAGVSRASSF